MSAEQTTELRLKSLEDWRREQTVLNKSISESLHRIELALQRTQDKACPAPGHCLVLENRMAGKWDKDVVRFEALEANYKTLQKHVDDLRQTVHRGMGALGVLIAIATFFGPWIVDAAKHFLAR